ncbi:hypothetical protein HQ403_02770 [Candidatus Kaiserbacteria bacterium]|nr:hypothetical protein [Candidatus Kaiserbacteria bacterium]
MDFFNTLSGAITTDIIIIFVVFTFLFLFSVRYGKSSSTSLLLSLYVGILTFLSFPYLEEATFLKSSEVQVTISHIVLFLVLVFMIHSVVRRFIFTEYSGSGFLKYGEMTILSGVTTALLFAFAYHTIPLATLYDFGDSIDSLFSSQYFFWWLVAPMAALLLVSRE